MGWQTESVIQLFAGNTIINPSGMFVYSGPPALGNLIVSIAPSGGTDTFGNAYQPGITAYSSSTSFVSMDSNEFILNFAQTNPGTIQELTAGTLILQTGTTGVGDSVSTIQLQSANAGSVAAPAIALEASLVQLNSTALNFIPTSSAGITTVAQVVSALKLVGIFS